MALAQLVPNEIEMMSPDLCPVDATMRVLGGKWKPLILYQLMGNTRRFGELKRLIPNITQQMLTLQLRELEQDGIVHREVYRQVPPKVEYWLTPIGQRLEPVFNLMLAWGVEYTEALKADALSLTDEHAK